VTDEILTDPISANTSRKGNYLSRHWRGQLSLAIAFWVNYIVPSVIFFVAGNILALNEADDRVGIPFLLIWLPIIYLAVCRYLAKRREPRRRLFGE
jgi:hypothetical protein